MYAKLVVLYALQYATIVPHLTPSTKRLLRRFDVRSGIIARSRSLHMRYHRPLDQSKVRPRPLINQINQIELINDSYSDFFHCEYRHASYFSKYVSYFSLFVLLRNIQCIKMRIEQKSPYLSMSEIYAGAFDQSGLLLYFQER